MKRHLGRPNGQDVSGPFKLWGLRGGRSTAQEHIEQALRQEHQDWIEPVDLTDDLGQTPVLPPTPESRDRGAGPVDALPRDRRVDLDAYDSRARMIMRAESDLRPMTEIRQEAIGDAARRDDEARAAEVFGRWYDGLAAGLRGWREAQAGIDGARQAAPDRLDAELDQPSAVPIVQAELPASLLAPRQARAAVRRALAGWGLAALAGDAELMTSELVANAVEHGDGQGDRADHPAV
jgi:hypothetical protein